MMNKHVIKVVAIHAAIYGLGAATATVVLDLVKLAVADKKVEK